MKNLSVRAVFLLIALSLFAVGMAYGDVTVTFPSDTSFSCNLYNCTFLGSNGSQSEPLFTTGDFVTEIFFTGQTGIYGLAGDFFLIDNLGGNPGAQYETGLYVNNVLVASFWVPDCNYCGLTYEVSGAVSFPYLEGDGTYALTFDLLQTVPGGDGNFILLAPGSITLVDTPEPGSLVLLGTGALGLAAAIRRRF